MTTTKKVRVAAYGFNGHQILHNLASSPWAEIVAVAKIPVTAIPPALATVRRYESLQEILTDPDIDLVSLCSPYRSEQAGNAVACLNAGKHVYAEKPCAITEESIDSIINASRRSGCRFHEQAGIAFQEPYLTLRQIAASGQLGEIVQIYGQKSYPWVDTRPQDENIDGGLAMQAGIYIARFVEHVAGVRISGIKSERTPLGNPVSGGGCQRASGFLMTLANGGIATGVANYLCPPPADWGNWGYETLRIWGTHGFVEAIDGGKLGRLCLIGKGTEVLNFSSPGQDYLEMVIREIHDDRDVIPWTIEEELSPTRWVIRAVEQRSKS